jgi:hypothetical protein
MYTSGAAAIWRSGPPAEGGGEVALKKSATSAHRALARLWLATVLVRLYFWFKIRLSHHADLSDATLPRETIYRGLQVQTASREMF